LSRYLVRRLIQAAGTWLIVVTLTFVMIQLAPGGPRIMMNPDLTPEDQEVISHSLGLDEPIHVQYTRWLISLAGGDFGLSFSDRSPVLETIMARLPNTLRLSVAALTVSVVMGMILGIVSATQRYRLSDLLVSIFAFVGVSIPAFWFGIVLILIFSVKLGWLPAAGMYTIGRPPSFNDYLRHMIMPVSVLAYANLAFVARYTRSSLLNVLSEDYIRTAHAKGLAQRIVLGRHALKNALIPVVTVVGLRLPVIFGGTVITESVFAWPGMGRLGVNATLERDYPVIMGVTVMMAGVVLLTNLLTDIVYVYIDPRVRLA